MIKNDYQKYYTVDELIKENSLHYQRVVNTLYYSIKGTKILDVGAGVGTISFPLQNDGTIDLTAIEINHEFAEYLRKNNVKVIEGDAFEIMSKIEDNSFDEVILGEIVEHMKNPGILLKEAFRIARGRVVFSLPRNDDDWHYWRCDWASMKNWVVLCMEKKDDGEQNESGNKKQG